MEIRFLVINGSERSNGNTEIAIDIAKSILNKISGDNKVIFDVISLKDLMIKSCNDCHEVENCNYRKEPCQQNDDIKIVLKKMKEADCLIYATPVHGFGMPSLMQSFIDRVGVGYLRFERPLSNKIGGIIAVGRRYAHASVFSQLIQNFLLNRMIVVVNGFSFYLNEVKCEIEINKEGIDSLYRMAIRMFQFALFIKLNNEKVYESNDLLNNNERKYTYSLNN